MFRSFVFLVFLFGLSYSFAAIEDCPKWDPQGEIYVRKKGDPPFSHNGALWLLGEAFSWVKPEEGPGQSPKWDKLDLPDWKVDYYCLKDFSRVDRDTLSSDSSEIILPQDYQPFTAEVQDWKLAKEKTDRCDLTMDTEAKGQCIFPYQLQNSHFVLPQNVTRFSKDAFKLCSMQVENDPTVVVYIMDHSKSMEWNDSTKIADDAVKKALETQYGVDSNSWAAYIPFNSEIQTEFLVEPQQLSNGGLSRITAKVNSDYEGGTKFVQPLNKAQEWLSDSRFDGYNKLIVFLADGEPDDTVGKDTGPFPAFEIVQAKDFPVIHSVYLTEDSIDAGAKVMDYLSWVTMDKDSLRGTFTWVKDVHDLQETMQGIIEAYVASVHPEEMYLTNRSLNISISVDKKNLERLEDSTYAVKMENNMPLLPGVNHMTLKSRYAGISGMQNINFTIEITDSIVNESMPLTNAPFRTKCEEITGLSILDQDRNRVDFLENYNQDIWVQYAVIKEGEKGSEDSLKVWLVTELKDTLDIFLRKNNELTTSSLVYYDRKLPVHWMQEVASNDSKLQLNYLDHLYALYQHPDDPQDRAQTDQKVYWSLPDLDSAVFKDENQDGKLDQIELFFPREIYTQEWKAADLVWNWPGMDAEWKSISLKDFGQVDHEEPSFSKAIWTINENKILPIFTGQAKDAKFIKSYERSNWRSLDTIKTQTVDKMPPVFKSARIRVGGEERPDTLKLVFSENIHWNQIDENERGELFDFILDDVEISQLKYSEAYRFGDSAMRIVFGEKQNSHFNITPGDSIRMIVNSKFLRDEVGNLPFDPNPWFYIGGELRQRGVFAGLGTPDEKNSPKGSDPVKLTIVDGKVDAKAWFEKNNTLGMTWGPFRLQGDELERDIIKWRIQIFDNIGQFVNQMEGKIDCNHHEMDDRCYSDEGVSLVFEWNYRCFKDRMVGTGAYVIQAVINGKTMVSTVGVLRKE